MAQKFWLLESRQCGIQPNQVSIMKRLENEQGQQATLDVISGVQTEHITGKQIVKERSGPFSEIWLQYRCKVRQLCKIMINNLKRFIERITVLYLLRVSIILLLVSGLFLVIALNSESFTPDSEFDSEIAMVALQEENQQLKNRIFELEHQDYMQYRAGIPIQEKVYGVHSASVPFDPVILMEIYWNDLSVYVPRENQDIKLDITPARITVLAEGFDYTISLIPTVGEFDEFLSDCTVDAQNISETYETVLEKFEPSRAFVQSRYCYDGVYYVEYNAVMRITTEVDMYIRFQIAEYASREKLSVLKESLQANLLPRFS